MSIVGPRPERPFFVEQFCNEIPEYNLRHRVKAGLTGLAQIQGKYNTSVQDKLKYDLLYINGYSLALDVKLIMQTLTILLKKSSTEGVKNWQESENIIDNLIEKE
jgi:lipopolysaccharide/colanic/teichoic acid biosynthesis glycosyltransferase